MRQLVAALEKTHSDLTAQEIADILWLALQQWQQSAKDTVPIKDRPPISTPSSSPSSTTPRSSAASPTPSPGLSAPLPSPTPVTQLPQTQQSMAGLTSQSKAASASGSNLDAPLAVPDAPALRNSLELIKALRPLIRQVPSVGVSELDVPATVKAIAETDLWVLKTRPVLEPWLELALVVDATASMVIWQRTALNLRRALSQSGIFRDVRMWSLEPQRVVEPTSSDIEEKAADRRLCIRAGFGPSTEGQPSCRPQELLDPRKRRVVLVVSDCIAPYWETEEIRDVLQVWSGNGSMALVQVLPESLWERTNLLQVTRGQFYSAFAGQSSQDLNFVRRGQRRRRQPTGVKVPVFTLQPKVVERWSKMMAGSSFTPSPGLIFSPVFRDDRWSPVDVQSDRKSKSQTEIPPQRRLEKFRNFSTPMARRMVGLLAACPEINLPIIRMVQAAMLPESRQSHVAEVLLGGLFKSQGSLTAHTPADTIQYSFHDGVRPLIQDAVPPDRTFAVLSKWINSRFGYSLEDFVVQVNAFGSDEWGQMKPFAGVLVDLLKRRGERYKEIIQTLEGALDIGIINLPLEEFPCESVKIIALPSEPTRIPTTVTKYVRSTLPSPGIEYVGIKRLERIRFVEEIPDDNSFSKTLEFFPIRMATVEQQDSEWVVTYEDAVAQGCIEILPEGIELALVAVPSGSFIMGALEDEPERGTNEIPQHEVVIPYGFFMGRYPVTQAQWRVVAALPQVNQELNPDSSIFKGGDRPVENINWYEAVEFCDRLNQYFEEQSPAFRDYEYRLPTEAEWEYACRAGTTTPFHFGSMIIKSVASYNGTSYAGGPLMEGAGETTPVTQFNHANYFGLSDMHGNVNEWCLDHSHKNYADAPTDGSAWIEGGNSDRRFLRGGSWNYHPRSCRSAARPHLRSSDKRNDIGFRVVFAPD